MWKSAGEEGLPLGAVKVKTVNDQLLYLRYSEDRNIKMFLRNWAGLESLSLKGDTVATCILLDLKMATGIDPEKFGRSEINRFLFELGWKEGVLNYYQFVSIAYVMVLGYTQDEVAFMIGIDRSVISKYISKGIKKIQTAVKAYRED